MTQTAPHPTAPQRSEAAVEGGGEALAHVWLGASGAPERLVWRGARYLVTSRPTPWVDRSAWWQGSGGVAAMRGIDVMTWRVDLSEVDGEAELTADLQPVGALQWRVLPIEPGGERARGRR